MLSIVLALSDFQLRMARSSTGMQPWEIFRKMINYCCFERFVTAKEIVSGAFVSRIEHRGCQMELCKININGYLFK